jgi:hypothetical protein
MPEPWEYCQRCRREFKTEEEYNAHFVEVERLDIAERFIEGDTYGEVGVTIEEIQALTGGGRWLMQFVLYRQ